MTTELTIRVASIIPNTTAEGPGQRFAVWVQGCTIQCDGCFNPHMWTARGGTPMTPEELTSQLPTAGISGVTILGGEPFEQARPLARFARLVKDRGLSVMVFTGHLLADLQAEVTPGARELLAQVDLLVDGPYVVGRQDSRRPWVGSENQRFHFLSDRYRHLQRNLTEIADRVEIRIAPTGEVRLNGWAPVDRLDELLAGSTTVVGRGRVR